MEIPPLQRMITATTKRISVLSKLIFTHGLIPITIAANINLSQANEDKLPIKNTINIAGVKIPLMIIDSKNGYFVKLMKEAGERTGINIRVHVLPGKRASSMFKSGHYDGYMPMTGTFRPIIPGPRTPSMYTKRTFAFVRQGSDIPQSLNELESRSVGLNFQYDNAPELINNDRIKIVQGVNDVSMMKMLAAKRFDVLVTEEKTGLAALNQSGVENITYDQRYPITSTEAYVLFQNTAQGHKTAKKLSIAMEAMKLDGSYDRIYDDIMNNAIK